MLYALLAAVVLGAASTLGDMLWAGLSLRHRVVYGLVHGALICLLIGAFIGARAGSVARGVLGGPIIGVLAAAVFYMLAPWLGYYGMFPAWMFFWICFAAWQKVLLRESSWIAPLARGVIAASASGAAFYAISGIWIDPPRGGPNYLYNFGAWTVAFLPGFGALFIFPSKR